MAEGARLEIVWVVYSRLEGSNPSLSAIIVLYDSNDNINRIIIGFISWACFR